MGRVDHQVAPGVKIAQLKSSRSFTFTLVAVFRSVTPICSAIPANWLLKTSSITGSDWARHGRARLTRPRVRWTDGQQQFAASSALRPPSPDR